MHDGPARRDVTTEGKRGAAARHQVMSRDVERLMEVMCRAETATIRAPRKATTTVAAAATARGARTLARSPLARLRRICLGLPGAWEKVSHGEATFWVITTARDGMLCGAKPHTSRRVCCSRGHQSGTSRRRTSARVDGSAFTSTTHRSGLRLRSDCFMHTNWRRPDVYAPPRRVYEAWTFLKSARKNQA
jgi:hypothetical protein